VAFDVHFQLADDLITHLDITIGGVTDPFIQSRYTGFLAVATVTVMELTMKQIFVEFAAGKHRVLNDFVVGYFDRINGRITLKQIKEEYLTKFGERYKTRFERRLEKLERKSLKESGTSLKSSYGNLITWRNEFAHEGNVPANASYAEVKKSYECAKEVMRCLSGCMNR
jgi:hypothetical protein